MMIYRIGNYLLDEPFLTKIVNYEIPENISKEEFTNYLDAMEKL